MVYYWHIFSLLSLPADRQNKGRQFAKMLYFLLLFLFSTHVQKKHINVNCKQYLTESLLLHAVPCTLRWLNTSAAEGKALFSLVLDYSRASHIVIIKRHNCESFSHQIGREKKNNKAQREKRWNSYKWKHEEKLVPNAATARKKCARCIHFSRRIIAVSATAFVR